MEMIYRARFVPYCLMFKDTCMSLSRSVDRDHVKPNPDTGVILMLSQRSVDKIAVIDFDGTLCKFAFPDVGPVEPGVKEALETLKKAGYTIKIHSCRTAYYWGDESERAVHAHLIKIFMEKHELPYDELILSCTMDKPIADVYIDDRAIKYDNNWSEIARLLSEK